MDFDFVTCTLELATVVFYGFLILAMFVFWSSESNCFMVLFCLSNGILALVGAFKPAENGTHCHVNGLLTMFAITLGFEALNCGQAERKRMASHQFRFYHRRPVYHMLLRTILFAIAASAMSWSFYSRSTKLGICFVRASESARLAETVVGFFWILFFYIKPTIFSIRKSLGLMSDCHHQIQILKHERELKIDSQLLLFKDHHRRLFNVIFTIVSQINLFSWICLTIPYVIQVVSLVAGLGGALIRLEEWSDWNATVLVGITRSLPLVNCFFLICAFAVYAISAI